MHCHKTDENAASIGAWKVDILQLRQRLRSQWNMKQWDSAVNLKNTEGLVSAKFYSVQKYVWLRCLDGGEKVGSDTERESITITENTTIAHNVYQDNFSSLKPQKNIAQVK